MARSVCLCVLDIPVSPAKRMNQFICRFIGTDSLGPWNHVMIDRGYTLAPTGEYDGSICAAVSMLPVATIRPTVATCFSAVRDYC